MRNDPYRHLGCFCRRCHCPCVACMNRRLAKMRDEYRAKPAKLPKCCFMVPMSGTDKWSQPPVKRCHFKAVVGSFCRIHDKMFRKACEPMVEQMVAEFSRPTPLWDLVNSKLK